MLTAEAIFAQFLLPLYPAGDLEAMRKDDANPGKNPALLAQLADVAETFVAMHASALGRDCALDFSDASVHRLSAALGPELRDRLARSGAPGTAESALFNVVVHGAAYVGESIVRSHGGAWLVRRPLWESRVRLASHAGEAELAPLSWWLRALADEEPAGLAERYRAYVEVPTTDPSALAIIGAPRALPRLKKPRYDAFYKYLRAHLPELKDVGADFPSPERFEAYAFRWLDFLLVGGGRMLVVAGPGEGGLHAFWLTRSGFSKSALFSAAAMPEPIVRADGDKIAFVVAHEGKTVVHETLWWGP
ncbi:MAG TPA: hypothetical protein VGH28_01475 [Polyangiaceae bacterium]|jgi:hypothetical protein